MHGTAMYPKHTPAFRSSFLALALVAGALSPAGLDAQQRASDDALRSALPDALSSAFRDAASHALPSVVFVGVERTVEAMAFLPESQREYIGDSPVQTGSGSGFVIDESGLVMTNHHVVDGAEAIRVRMHDGHEYNAEVVASDPTTDVAVIRLDLPAGRRLTVAETGDSQSLRVGDWVLALGNPLGLDFTVTAGIVSAVGRQLNPPGGASLESYIQTDAAINPGNSGGPLIDLRGRVVGINSAISGPRFIGYGFAVPIEMAQRVASDLVAYGHVRRPRLGVGIHDVTEVDAEVYGLDDISGAEVIYVEPNSAAAAAGVLAGDVVTQLDGEAVRNATALTARLALFQPGEEIEIMVMRAGEPRRLTARLGEFPPRQEPQPIAGAPAPSEHRLGFHLAPLTPAIARELEREATDPRFRVVDAGVYVASVAQRTAAWNAGLRTGQVLTSVNGREVTSATEAEALVARLTPGDAVSMRVLDRHRGEMVVNFRVR